MTLKILKSINSIIEFFFNLKFLRFNQHFNGTYVIKFKEKYLKVSLSIDNERIKVIVGI